MSTIKQLKLEQKAALQQQEVLKELMALAKDIERCDKTVNDLKSELESVHSTHQTRATTRQEIAYLTDLLKCANQKLVWEKQMMSLQKRTPVILERVSQLMSDPAAPPDDQTRASVLTALQSVQGAMERLQNVKVD